MKKILAIDPGEVESAWVEYLPEIQQIVSHGKTTNEGVMNVLIRSEPSDFAIEMVQCFGMPVGRETFETCLWIGRFLWEFERFEYKGINPSPVKTAKIFRKTVCGHICNNACAKDSNIRQALIDRFGGSKEKAIGFKKSPGPLYKMCEDARSALAVAITYAETNEKGGA